jgi:hypothetical protein
MGRKSIYLIAAIWTGLELMIMWSWFPYFAFIYHFTEIHNIIIPYVAWRGLLQPYFMFHMGHQISH